MPKHNKKPDDLIWYLLREQADGTSIAQIHRDMLAIAEEQGRADWAVNRTTLYDILRRFNVGTRSETQALHDQMVKETRKLTRQMIRHMNGTVPREQMMASLGDYEAKWLSE